METLLLALLVILLAVGGLALGVAAGRPPLTGSCGGLACHKGIACRACKRRPKGEPE